MSESDVSAGNRLDLLVAGLEVQARGLHHLIPVGEDKRPVIRWRNGAKDYATEEATREDLERWAQDPRAHGLAVVGNADTGVCVIDVEAAGMRVPAIREALEALPPSASGTP